MDDPRWLRVITVGLVLAALAVGYYIFTGAFSLNKTANKATSKTEVIKTESTKIQVATIPTPSAKPSNNPQTAYEKIILRNQEQVQIQTLPKTGYPVGLLVILSISVMISGIGLRKFPH